MSLAIISRFLFSKFQSDRQVGDGIIVAGNLPKNKTQKRLLEHLD